MMRLASLCALLALPLLGGACRLGTDEGLVGVSVPGAAARVVLHRVQAAGGHVTWTTMTVDSATARYEVVTCSNAGSGTTCGQEVQRRSGEVPAASLGQLFATARSSSFRSLRAEYRRAGDIVPPDGGGATLTVVAGERERKISWESGATVPDLLLRYVCWMDSIQGWLINCG